MGFKETNWLKGCGIGCGAMVLLGILLSVGGGLWFRGMFRGVDRAEDSADRLAEVHGDPHDYVPAPDQSIPAARMEIFLAVRDSISADWEELERVSTSLPEEVESAEGAPRKVFAVIKGLAGMINPFGEYIDRRNRLLLEAGMGLGEYLHIYTTAYYAWLGKDAGAGPEVADGGKRRRIFDGDDGMFSASKNRRLARGLMMDFLRNSIDALPGPEESRGDPATAELLREELRRCDLRPRELPWAEGPPPAAVAALEPWRERLEAFWHGPTNCFELPREFKRGWTINVD